MTWANVRATMVASIAALTPGSRPARRFTYVDDGLAEEQALIRGFDVSLVAGPSQVGQVLNNTAWRFITECQISVFYPRMESRAEQEQLISEDAVQLQQTMLQKGNHHANVEGLVPVGDGYSNVSVDYDEVGNAVLRVPLVIHHL